MPMPCAPPQNSPPPPRARGSTSTSFAEDALSSPSPYKQWKAEKSDDARPSEWLNASPVRRRPALGSGQKIINKTYALGGDSGGRSNDRANTNGTVVDGQIDLRSIKESLTASAHALAHAAHSICQLERSQSVPPARIQGLEHSPNARCVGASTSTATSRALLPEMRNVQSTDGHPERQDDCDGVRQELFPTENIHLSSEFVHEHDVHRGTYEYEHADQCENLEQCPEIFMDDSDSVPSDPPSTKVVPAKPEPPRKLTKYERQLAALGYNNNLMETLSNPSLDRAPDSPRALDVKRPFRPAPRHHMPNSPVTRRKTPPSSPTLATYRDCGMNPGSIAASHRAVLRNTPSSRSRRRQDFASDLQEQPPIKGNTCTPVAKWRNGNGQKPKICAKDEFCVQILSSKGGGNSGSGGCMAVHVVDGIICVAHADKTINLWSLRTCQFVRSLKGHKGVVRALTAHTPRNFLASGSDDRDVRLWSLPDYKPAFILVGHKGAVTSLEIITSDELLVSASEDKTIRLWDLKHGGAPFKSLYNAHAGGILALKRIDAPTDPRLQQPQFNFVSGGRDRILKMWNHSTESDVKKCCRILESSPHYDAVTALCSPPSSIGSFAFFSASRDMNIRVWSALDGEPLAHYVHVHSDWILDLQYCPLRGELLSASKDSTICIWDAFADKRGGLRARFSLRGHIGPVNCLSTVSYEQNNLELILSGGSDGTVRIWKAPPPLRWQKR